MTQDKRREIKLSVSIDNEGTSYPYWIIIDPEQNFSKGDDGVHRVASMITGLFMSREEAQDFLDRTRYNFSKHARVYCHSGNYGQSWVKANNEALKIIQEERK